jgi:hypothetical protein
MAVERINEVRSLQGREGRSAETGAPGGGTVEALAGGSSAVEAPACDNGPYP